MKLRNAMGEEIACRGVDLPAETLLTTVEVEKSFAAANIQLPRSR
jgi:hypothetical protein